MQVFPRIPASPLRFPKVSSRLQQPVLKPDVGGLPTCPVLALPDISRLVRWDLLTRSQPHVPQQAASFAAVQAVKVVPTSLEQHCTFADAGTEKVRMERSNGRADMMEKLRMLMVLFCDV